jgi:acyl carrier protein
MSTSTQQQQMDQIKSWLVAKKPEIQDIDPDFDIIENRVIDSLSFTEFILFLEEVSGREIQLYTDSVNVFRTLRSIQDNIINGAAA